MILPITAYGKKVLREKGAQIKTITPEIQTLIADMWQTIYAASGMGLAAPQVNQSLQLFIVDTQQVYDKMDQEEKETFFPDEPGIKETFINSEIIEMSDDVWSDVEGCLSLPSIEGEVEREWSIKLRYLNAALEEQVTVFTGLNARVILHEYDHTQGVLFIDRLSALKQRILKKTLNKIAAGEVEAKYDMDFA
ncbi:MAG: peptide deformylase [Candidatus Marinimicrobia bacterium]|nr:peptide deformylase [Candidatus Neomarinimicrobiota bacterium]